MSKALDILYIDDEQFGGHATHWQLLTPYPEQMVNQWLQDALEQPLSPMGLCLTEQQLPCDRWLLQSATPHIQVSQVIAVDGEHPTQLLAAFPVIDNPLKVSAKISRIVACSQSNQAILALDIAERDITVYGFDTLYAVNASCYQADTYYDVQISAWAYSLELVPEQQQLLIEDEAAIRHHRALNSILAAHDGKTPDNLQQLLADWQPQTPEDTQPVTIEIAKMVAYLYGEHLGQEDEAWFQGNIVGKSSTQFMQQDFVLYDVNISQENPDKPVIIRIAYRAEQPQFEVGQFIRGNIWIQFKIHSTSKT